MKREFYYQDDRSNKFWTIELVGEIVITTNGRFGATPRETRHGYDNNEKAIKAAEREINSKLQKGYVEGALATAPKYQKPDWATMEMNEDVFWRLIALFNWKHTGDDDAVIARTVNALKSMGIEQILKFEELLAQKLYALDTKTHAMSIGDDAYVDTEQYFSPDGFLYARCCVIANGKAVYEKVLNNPDEFPKNMEFEAILYIASTAYEEKTGNEYAGFNTSVSYETFSNHAGW